MKAIRQVIIGAVALLFISAIHTFAIEGIQLSVQSSNVVLSWPSVDDGSETYIIQYRPTLNSTDSWTTLTDFYPAAMDTNMTSFVHSNIVQYPAGMDSDAGGNIQPSGMSSGQSMLMVKPANDSGNAVPLAIYPPGFDLTGFDIFDSASGELMKGDGYSVRPAASPAGGAQPMDYSPGDDDTNPYTGFYRVVRDGAHLFGITNDMTLSGIVTIPVEVASGVGNLSTISLTEDDSPVGNSIQNAPFNLPLALVVDTTQMSNGVHQISASARWDVYGPTNDETVGGEAEADSPPVSVTISNEISFPNWVPQFGELGNSLLIWANSAHTNADYYIDVYGSDYNYIGTLGGHTDDGNIEGSWNLVGPDGTVHTNDTFFIFAFTTVYDDPESAYAIAPPIYKKLEQWLGAGAWVAVEQHAWDGYINSDSLYSELSGFIGGAKEVGWQVNPSPSEDDLGDWDAYALHTDSSGDNDWAQFRQALYDPHSRNLVYFGHGGPNGIGHNPADPNRYISATEIENMLHTVPIGQTNSHSFRFVFLDGCSTAKGSLPEAFGIFHKENVSGDVYADASLRYSAFVGWPKDKAIGFGDNTGQINTDHVNFITHIQQELLGGGLVDDGEPQPIKQAIINAATTYFDTGSFGPNDMKVYGFWGLTFGLDND